MDGRLHQGVSAVETTETQVSVEKDVQKANKRFDEALESRPE